MWSNTATVLCGLSMLAVAFGVSTNAAQPKSMLTTFEDVQWETYRHADPKFSIRYPYAYRVMEATTPGQVFSASDSSRLPSVNVSVAQRVAALPLQASAAEAAKRVSPGAKVVSERDVDLAGVPARVAVVEWSAPFGLGVALRTLLVSAYHDDDWVVVTATDGATGGPMLPDLETSALSLRFE